MKIGITFGAFDLLHAGHIMMLEEAKRQCDQLIVGLHLNPKLSDATRNKPVQSIVERYIQLEGCSFVDEIIVYETEEDVLDLLQALPIAVRILGEEYRDVDFTGKQFCLTTGISLHYNNRSHRFSTSSLGLVVANRESEKQKIA